MNPQIVLPDMCGTHQALLVRQCGYGPWLQRSASAAFEAGRVTADMPAWTRIGSTAIDWVICGGESGPHARPMHPDWVRSLRDQCAEAGVAFHFKQWGEWTPGENVERQRGIVDTAFLWEDGWHVYPLNLTTDHGHIDDQPDLYRVGLREAGRLLDGVEHNAESPHEPHRTPHRPGLGRRD